MRRITSLTLAAPEFSISLFCTTVRAPAKFFVLAAMLVPSRLLLTWIDSSTGPALSALLATASCASEERGMPAQARATASTQGRRTKEVADIRVL